MECVLGAPRQCGPAKNLAPLMLLLIHTGMAHEHAAAPSVCVAYCCTPYNSSQCIKTACDHLRGLLHFSVPDKARSEQASALLEELFLQQKVRVGHALLTPNDVLLGGFMLYASARNRA